MLKFGEIFSSYYDSDDSLVLSEVKLDIVKLLAEFRVLNIYQIVDFLRLDNPEIKRENVYFHLQSLKKSKMVQQDDLPTNHRVKYYYLTKKGLGVLGSAYKPYRTPMYQLAHTKAVNDSVLLWCQLMYDHGVNWAVVTERARLHQLTDGEKTGVKYQLADFYIWIPIKGWINVEVELTQKTVTRYEKLLNGKARNRTNVLYLSAGARILEIIEEFKENWIEERPVLDEERLAGLEKDLEFAKEAVLLWDKRIALFNHEDKTNRLIESAGQRILSNKDTSIRYGYGSLPKRIIEKKEANKRVKENRNKIEELQGKLEILKEELTRNEEELLENFTHWKTLDSQNDKRRLQLDDYSMTSTVGAGQIEYTVATEVKRFEHAIHSIKVNYQRALTEYKESVEEADCIQGGLLADKEQVFRQLIEKGIAHE